MNSRARNAREAIASWNCGPVSLQSTLRASVVNSVGYIHGMMTSIRASLLAALLAAGADVAQAQVNAEAMVRTSLRTALGEMDVARTYRIYPGKLLEQNGMDITTAHAVPRSPIASSVYQVTFRNVSGPPVCTRFKVMYEDDQYHDPQFVQSTSENHLVAPRTHVNLLAVWGTIEGQTFNTPKWRFGYFFWEPAPEGEKRCEATAPSDLDAWIASRYDTYAEFRRTRP